MLTLRVFPNIKCRGSVGRWIPKELGRRALHQQVCPNISCNGGYLLRVSPPPTEWVFQVPSKKV